MPGLCQLPGFAAPQEAALVATLRGLEAVSPFRQLCTPGGRMMSVATTNCGAAGWISDRRGYRYAACDPLSRARWPALPATFAALAKTAAAAAGFENFIADACLINRYRAGAKMALHQDRDEADFSAPIVSVSLGLEAVFLWGGATRAETPARLALSSGDVVVWVGAARLNFHGILPVKPGHHQLLGDCRVNLTFRRAL